MNRIRCAKCGDLLHSKHVHDWVSCSCKAVYVDGGDRYCHLGGHPEDIIIVEDDGTERGFLDVAKHDGEMTNAVGDKPKPCPR